MAEYAPNDERWQAIAPFVSQHLTTAVSPVYLGQWSGLFQPASQELTDSLTAIHADRSRSEKQREPAAFLLSEYLRDQPDKLTEAILFADELAEYSSLIAVLKPHSAAVHQRLLDEMRMALPAALRQDQRSTLR